MRDLDIQHMPHLIETGSDVALANQLAELNALVDGLKEAGSWDRLKGRAELRLVRDALRSRIVVSRDDDVLAICLNALEAIEGWDDPEFLVKTLAHATRRTRKADQVLYAALRLGLAAELLDEGEYVSAVGNSMNSLEVDKHLRVAEMILHPRGLPTAF